MVIGNNSCLWSRFLACADTYFSLKKRTLTKHKKNCVQILWGHDSNYPLLVRHEIWLYRPNNGDLVTSNKARAIGECISPPKHL